MKAIPPAYAWIDQEPGPRMLLEARALYGTVEVAGGANSPAILAWAQEVALKATYTADSIPWCGLFMAVVAKRAGKPLPSTPLWALSWSQWGNPAGQPRLGDVLTFKREGGGHVALYVGEDTATYHVLGGNQGDAVTITRIAKERMHAARRLYATAMPANCRPIILAPNGAVSRNEA